MWNTPNNKEKKSWDKLQTIFHNIQDNYNIFSILSHIRDTNIVFANKNSPIQILQFSIIVVPRNNKDDPQNFLVYLPAYTL